MAKKTPPKARGPRPAPPSPELVFEPWSRAAQTSVIGGLAALIAIVALTLLSWDGLVPPDLGPSPVFDAEARRAALVDATAKTRDAAFAKVSWGATAGATTVTAGNATPVPIPVSDGRAVASIGFASSEAAKRANLPLTVTVFAGDRRLFGNVLSAQDASGPTDAVTISFNANAVRDAGIGAEPLTVRIDVADATAGSYRDRPGQPAPPAIAEARLIVTTP